MLDLKREIQSLRKRLTTMEQLEAIQSDPEQAALAREVFGGGTKKAKEERDDTSRQSLLHKIIEWFKANNRESATLEEMASGVGVSKSSVRQIVYTRAKDSFEKTGVNDTRESVFRLKE